MVRRVARARARTSCRRRHGETHGRDASGPCGMSAMLLRQTSAAHRAASAAMSVLLETSLGDITIDLLVDDAPKCCEK